MTASEYIKSHGLPGMVYLAKQTGKDRRTLYKWYAEQFEFFEIIVLGCVSKGEKNDIKQFDKETKKFRG